MPTIQKIRSLIIIFFLAGCSLAPGMHMETKSSWLDDDEYVYISSLKKDIRIVDIQESLDSKYKYNHRYKIGIGDQIAVTIWGLPEVFPITNVNQEFNLRRVDSNGNIFFPYTGLIKAYGKTQDELRDDLTESLSNFFNDPQADITIVRFNSQQVFILGEVTKPLKINLTDIPISLSDALGTSFGLKTNTAAASEVFIIRQTDVDGNPKIYHADLKNPSNFIDAGNFYLMNNDIVYVNSSGTTRWNKVISQFFPFSSFLNSIDNLTNNN